MAMGQREPDAQGDLWIVAAELPRGGAHPFYDRIKEILKAEGFDAFVESKCRKFYAEKLGRPFLPPAVGFAIRRCGVCEAILFRRGKYCPGCGSRVGHGGASQSL